MIAVEHLSKEFGRIHAVHDVSFRAGHGEVVGLLGPNGSGKTTIMRTLAGFFPPTSGRAWVAGVDVTRESLRARTMVGYLPENVALYPEMRVRQLLAFCADVRRLRGTLRRERLAAVELACGLHEVRGRLVSQLSKGYRQRVGLAQALLHDPSVLLLDEPTVGLDPRQILEIRELIRSLRGRTTVLLSTHILSEASSVCDHVVIMNRGQVVAEDRAQALAGNLGEAERTLVRLGGPEIRVADVVSALREVSGVERVEPAADASGECNVVVHARGGDEVRSAIASVIVRRGWPLTELRPLSPTLEDLFLRLVGEGAPAEPQ